MSHQAVVTRVTSTTEGPLNNTRPVDIVALSCDGKLYSIATKPGKFKLGENIVIQFSLSGGVEVVD